MNLYEVVGRIEINKKKVEAIKGEIAKLFGRIAFVVKEPEQAGAKTVEFLRTEADRLEELLTKKAILEGEIASLSEQLKIMSKEEE